ncbi:MAG: hypothetical protein JOZ99_10460 [Actinobacteria bacterium]|nr:hypothetical protein [Actinomycetota bacterium]
MRWRTRVAVTAVSAMVASTTFVGVGVGATAPADAFGGRAGTTVRAGGAHIDWDRLRNPILGYPDRAAKDPAIVQADGRFVALFSAVDAAGRWRIGIATSHDLARWSPLRFLPHDATVEGEASPDIVRAPDGRFVVTFQSFVHDAAGAEAKLWYRTTRDFRSFSPAHRLGFELHPARNDRLIDPALVWSPAGLLLGYKVGSADGVQAFELARSVSGTLAGPWTVVGRPDIRVLGDTIENYQFLHVDGRHELLATSNSFDRTYLFDLAGDARDPRGWLHWTPGRQLVVPQEAWNPGSGLTGVTYEHANCAFVVDRRRISGWAYLVFADSPELTTFGGAGHARLAVARSRDLVHWDVPPER